MRSVVWLAALAACAVAPPAPTLPDAPARALESELRRAGDEQNPLRRCLHIVNHTGHAVAVFVDGRHEGWLGAGCTAAYYVGGSAGPRTKLTATCRAGSWEATVGGPVWDLTWHLR